MSEPIENNWQPRKENVLKFSTGNACVVQKPGPELGFKTAHLHRRLKALRAVSVGPDGQPLAELSEEEKEDAGFAAFEKMSAEQRATGMEIMRITVAACVKRPRIYVNPQPGQVGVDDIDESEFWAVWKWYADGCRDIVENAEGVSAADADRFPAEQAAGVGAGDSGGDVRPEAEHMDEAA